MIDYVKIMYLVLILSFVFVVVMDTNQQVNANEYYPNYTNPDFDQMLTYQKTESSPYVNINNNSGFLSQIMSLIQQLIDDSYSKGYNDGYQDRLEESTYAPTPTPTVKPTPTPTVKPMDYSKLCLDEYDNFQIPTIDINFGSTLTPSTVGMPVSGSGVIRESASVLDSVLITFVDPNNRGIIHETSIKSDGTFWKHVTSSDVFSNKNSFGEYMVLVQYDKQCGFKKFDHVRQIVNTTPTINEIPKDQSESIEVKYYKIPLPFDSRNFVNAHRSHAEIIEINYSVSCLDGKSSCFIPDKVTIPVGSEVIFVVHESDLPGTVHTIVQGTDRSKPYDGEFKADSLIRGGQFSHIFDKAGEYPYYSTRITNAEGIIIVK